MTSGSVMSVPRKRGPAMRQAYSRWTGNASAIERLGRSADPEQREVQLHRLEWLSPDFCIIRVRGEQDPAPLALVAKDFESAINGIDEPEPAHAFSAVDSTLASPIKFLRRGREHFAEPVRREREERRRLHHGHSLATPTRDVGHEDRRLRAKMRSEER